MTKKTNIDEKDYSTIIIVAKALATIKTKKGIEAIEKMVSEFKKGSDCELALQKMYEIFKKAGFGKQRVFKMKVLLEEIKNSKKDYERIIISPISTMMGIK